MVWALGPRSPTTKPTDPLTDPGTFSPSPAASKHCSELLRMQANIVPYVTQLPDRPQLPRHQRGTGGEIVYPPTIPCLRLRSAAATQIATLYEHIG